jgi:hypothetical protein
MKQIILLILFALCFAVIGWGANELYEDFTQERTLNGLWIDHDNSTKVNALETARKYDNKGDWICVNIQGMTIKEMVETCEHEAAHELFAEKCENNVTRCLERVGYEK